MDNISLESKIEGINFNYFMALQQAGKLEEVADRLKKCSADLSDAVDWGQRCWKGENADEYFRKTAERAEEAKVAAANYVKTAAAIRSIARRLYDMEMEGVRIARERTFRKDG